MGRPVKKTEDPVFAAMEEMVAKSGLQAVTQADAANYTKMFMKAFLERVMKGEMNHFLHEEKQKSTTTNSRNGYTSKSVATNHGTVRVTCPRERQGRFVPRLIPQHVWRFVGFDEQIVALYARGMSTRDIQNFLYEQYGTEVSASLISEVTDEIMLSVTPWQNWALEPMYPMVFFAAIRIKMRNAGDVVIPKAMHIAFGVRADGTKDILGLWLDDTESAAFWLNVFNELQARGVQDIWIAISDGVSGLSRSLETAFPRTTHQTCLVHFICNSLACVAQKNRAKIAAAIKPIYQALHAKKAQQELEQFAASEWGEKYPSVVK